MVNDGILIFSGYNQRAVLAFCRFAQKASLNIYIIAKDKDDTILFTDYKHNVIAIRNKCDLAVQDIKSYIKTIREKQKKRRIIVLPSSEYLNRFLLTNRKEIENENVVIPLCKKSLYEQISDKYSFGRLCKSFGIQIPQEYSNTSSIRFPCIAKPKYYFSSSTEILKPILLNNNDELNAFREIYVLKDFYYQKYLEGKSIYFLYYISRDGDYSVFSQENLIQQSHGKSIIAAKSTNVHKKKISLDFAGLLLQKKYSGLIMIELKLCDGTYYMIEANPRLWGPSQLILDSGMDLFHRFSFDYGLIQKLPKLDYKTDIKYFWSGGIVEDLIQGNRISFHNFTANDFIYDYHLWVTADVYLKKDSINLYLKELGSNTLV